MDESPEDTSDLVRDAQRGDEAARNRLFARYYDSVVRFARARMGAGIRRDFEAEDITQRALTVAVRKLAEFEMHHDSSFLCWLQRIVENQISDAVAWQHSDSRTHAREVALETLGPPSSFEPTALRPSAPQPIDELAGEEERRAVERCIASLRPPYRELIRARTIEGRTWEWIATNLGRPSPNAARMMYATATRKMAAALRRLRRGEHCSTSGR